MQISKWVALGVAAFCLVAVGGVVNMPHLYYMAAMLVTLPAVSYLLGWYTLRGLEFKRYSPTPIWEGDETEVTYIVTNKSRVTRFFVAIQEPSHPLIESVEMDPPLFTVKAGSSVEVRNVVRFTRRGVFQVGSFDVAALDPLGVFTFSRTISSTDEAVVYPMPRQMMAVDLLGSERLGWNDTPVYARHGDGVDSSGVRGYIPGDPLRRIHWRQTARTGQLTVIEFEETQSIDLKIVLDSAAAGVAGDEPDTSLEYAVRAAATIARDAIQNSATVELIVANRNSSDVARAWNGLLGERGDSRLYTLMDTLARVEAQSLATISDLVAKALVSVSRGTTLAVICIHPDKDLAMMLAKCIASGIGVTVVYIDTGSFDGTSVPAQVNRIAPVVAEAAALGAHVFTLSWNTAGALQVIPVD